MVDGEAARGFLADVAPLRACDAFDPTVALRLLSASKLSDDDELYPAIIEALNVSAVAMAAPTARNAAIARYALERAAIAVEGRLFAATSTEPSH